MKGWLYKWTNPFTRYQKRWFVLNNGILYYYWNPTEVAQTCRGNINLQSAVIQIVDSVNFVISLGGIETFYLQATNENEQQRWFAALEQAKARAIIRFTESGDNGETRAIPENEMKGWLYKWTNAFTRYQKRWFVLNKGILYYYWSETEVTHRCRGHINLQSAVIQIVDSSNFGIFIGGNQTFYLQATNEVEQQRWYTALELAKARAIIHFSESEGLTSSSEDNS